MIYLLPYLDHEEINELKAEQISQLSILYFTSEQLSWFDWNKSSFLISNHENHLQRILHYVTKMKKSAPNIKNADIFNNIIIKEMKNYLHALVKRTPYENLKGGRFSGKDSSKI